MSRSPGRKYGSSNSPNRISLFQDNRKSPRFTRYDPDFSDVLYLQRKYDDALRRCELLESINNQLRSEKSSQELDIYQLRKELYSRDTKIDILSLDKHNLNKQIADTERELLVVKALAGSPDKIRIRRLEDQLDTFRKAISERDNDLEIARAQRIDYSRRVSDLEAQARVNKERVALEIEKIKLESPSKQARLELTYEKQITHLEDQLRYSREDLNKAYVNIEGLKLHIEKLDAALGNATRDLKNSQDREEKQFIEIEGLKRENAKLKKTNDALMGEIDRRENERTSPEKVRLRPIDAPKEEPKPQGEEPPAKEGSEKK